MVSLLSLLSFGSLSLAPMHQRKMRAVSCHAPYGSPARGGVVMQVIGWLMAIALVAWFFHDYIDRESNPNRVPAVTATGEVVLKRDRAGHFTAGGTINGAPVTFMLDTGATQIAIPRQLAEQLGLKRGMPIDLLTAAGPARGYSTRLASVRLATIEAKDLGAVIADGMNIDYVLLGMNFLRRLEIIQRGDELILRAPGTSSK